MYIVRPGVIRDAKGYICEFSAELLMKLYQVSPDKCIELRNSDPMFEYKFCRYVSEGHIFLYPRSDENYAWIKNR